MDFNQRYSQVHSVKYNRDFKVFKGISKDFKQFQVISGDFKGSQWNSSDFEVLNVIQGFSRDFI